MSKKSKQNTHPKMELFGHDGNIFAILGRASRLLCENGQRDQSKEMCVSGSTAATAMMTRSLSSPSMWKLNCPILTIWLHGKKHQNQKNEVMPDEHSEQNKKEGMRLTNTENDLFSSGFVLPEHRGGDGWTILHGDALDIIPHFQPGAFDAVITDPPYAGGGAKPSEKTRTTNQKYSSMSADKALPDFDGDQKDQLSWMLWTAVWMSKVRAACKPGAPICVFIDWRQLPALACAMQWAGWIWRGVAVWDKMTSRPQKGRYRQQAEFMVWGSNGPMPLQRKVGCLPGVFRHANPANRIHVTEKPLPLMREVVQICEQGGRILDPFAGAGTTVLAAVQEGCEAVGIEVTNAYYELGTERLKNALQPTETAE